MKHNLLSNQSGFTMVEATISMALMSGVMVLTMLAFDVGSRTADVAGTKLRIGGDARIGMEKMTRELRNSNLTRITIPQANTIRFQVPTSVSNSGTITWSGWMQYSLGGTTNDQIIRTDLTTNVTTVIANKVTGVAFVANANPTTVTITVTYQDPSVYGYTSLSTLQGTVQFRNP